MSPSPDAIIVGAGPAGLACAMTMRKAGLRVTVLEKADSVGSVWRRHYDRLHLHSDRKHSGLPGMAMPRTYPLYPSRQQVVEYLENYAARFDIRPVFNTTVCRLWSECGRWFADAAGGSISAPVAVVATGLADAPYRPSWPGMELYRGPVIHSSEYRNPAPYAGKRVLVVGFGNSGGEIALDLAESGVDVALSVRGPVQVLPRDLLGFPIVTWAIFYQYLPAWLVDRINAPILRLALGRIDKLGLRLADQGTAADDPGAWTRAADRYRHPRQNPGWLHQDTWRNRSPDLRWGRCFATEKPKNSTRSFLPPASVPICAN